MFDSRRFVFTLGDVGHHSEVLNKIIWAWFNTSLDDVTPGNKNSRPYAKDASLNFVKVSSSQYGKIFMTGIFFYSGVLQKLVESTLHLRKEDLSYLPVPKPGSHPPPLNESWPICSAIHLKSNPEIRMIEQLNDVDAKMLSVFTPYGKIDDKVLNYCFIRNHHFEDDSDVDTIEKLKYNISLHEQINNKHDISLLYDIVHNTYHTIDELREITGVDPVTSEERLRNWLDVAHQVYKQHYER